MFSCYRRWNDSLVWSMGHWHVMSHRKGACYIHLQKTAHMLLLFSCLSATSVPSLNVDWSWYLTTPLSLNFDLCTKGLQASSFGTPSVRPLSKVLPLDLKLQRLVLLLKWSRHDVTSWGCSLFQSKARKASFVTTELWWQLQHILNQFWRRNTMPLPIIRFMRQQVEKEDTTTNVADFCSKSLSGPRLKELVRYVLW